MTRILVVQFCRLGDILQTTPMLRGLRRLHPGAEITLAVLDGFAHAPVPTHLYDRLASFPFERVAVALDGRSGSWQSAVREVHEFVASLGETPYDLTLNLTGNAVANLLCALVPAREVRGGIVAPDRTRIVRGDWMVYFWASLLARGQGAVNLVDLFRLVAGVPADGRGLEIAVTSEDGAFADDWLEKRGAMGQPLLALQLGASDERKRWLPESFAAMANLLPATAGRLLFVGAASERPLVERAVARLSRPWLDALGETTVPQLGALLRRARLLVTNDTGTMHVAAAVGTPIVDLSTGPVFVHETGAYAEGALAIEPVSTCFPCAAGAVCHHLSCRQDFSPADIAAVVQFALGEGPQPTPARARILRATRVESGRLEYRPIWNPGNGDDEALRQAFGRMWEITLPGVSCDAIAAGTPERDVPGTAKASERAAALGQLQRLAGRAADVARRIPRVEGTRQAELSAEIHHSLESAVRLGQLEPITQPIVGYLRTALESCAARDVESVSAVYCREWSNAARRAGILAELIAPRVESRRAS